MTRTRVRNLVMSVYSGTKHESQSKICWNNQFTNGALCFMLLKLLVQIFHCVSKSMIIYGSSKFECSLQAIQRHDIFPEICVCTSAVFWQIVVR